MLRASTVCILLAILCLASRAVAAAVVRPAGPAELRITIGPCGNAEVHFIVFTLPPKPDLIAKAVEETVGLKFDNVDWDNDEAKQVTAFTSQCAERYSRTALAVRGQIDLDPISKALAQLKVPSLQLLLIHQRASFSRCTIGAPTSLPEYPIVEYKCAVRPGQTREPVVVEFGCVRSDVLHAGTLLGGLALLLLGTMTAARRAASGAVGGLPNANTFASPPAKPWLIALNGLLWLSAIYFLQADFIGWHLAGIESYIGRMAGIVAATLAPLAAIAFVDIATVPGRRARSWTQNAWIALRSQTVVSVPTILVAAGIVARRNLDEAMAIQCFSAAFVTAAVFVGLSHWANAGPPQDATGAVRNRRTATIRMAAIFAGVIIVAPAIGVYFIRDWGLDESARPMAYLALLAATVGGVAFVDKWASSPGRRIPSTTYSESPADPRGTVESEGVSAEHGHRTKPGRSFAVNSLLSLFAVIGIVFWTSTLLKFRFDLAGGDEGWALVFIALAAALFRIFIGWRSLR